MIAERTFLGLDATTWIAILTGALVLVTGIYAWSTWKLVSEAKRSGEAAEHAAASSQKAAEASERAAAVAEARVDVRVDAEYLATPLQDSPGGVFQLTCRGDPIYVRDVLVDWIRGPNDTALTAMALHGQACEPAAPGRALPVRLRHDESTMFRWPRPNLEADPLQAGFVVWFTVLPDGDPDEKIVRLGSPPAVLPQS